MIMLQSVLYKRIEQLELRFNIIASINLTSINLD
jgi:hypothetical protein